MMSEIEARLASEWDVAVAPDAPALDGILETAAPEHASRRAVLVELEDVRLSCGDLRLRLERDGGDARTATRRWTVRQVIAHLAAWATRTRLELEALNLGTSLETIHFDEDGGPREWNQREVEARGAYETGALFDELDREWTQIADFVGIAPEAQLRRVVELPRTSGDPPTPWQMPVAAMVLGSCWHARYHLARLEHV